jgi:hypothetical protein
MMARGAAPVRPRGGDPDGATNLEVSMVAEQLRVSIQAATWELGLEQAELARRADLSESAISRFMRGERFLSAGAIDRVLEVLGLEVVVRSRRVRKGE